MSCLWDSRTGGSRASPASNTSHSTSIQLIAGRLASVIFLLSFCFRHFSSTSRLRRETPRPKTDSLNDCAGSGSDSSRRLPLYWLSGPRTHLLMRTYHIARQPVDVNGLSSTGSADFGSAARGAGGPALTAAEKPDAVLPLLNFCSCCCSFCGFRCSTGGADRTSGCVPSAAGRLRRLRIPARSVAPAGSQAPEFPASRESGVASAGVVLPDRYHCWAE